VEAESASFDHADLNTIKGIGGILKSLGEFSGRLAEIDVKGTTSTPDFSIDASGTSMEAVPFAVYSVPALAAAYLLPNESAQVAGNIENISPQQRKVRAANNMKRYGL